MASGSCSLAAVHGPLAVVTPLVALRAWPSVVAAFGLWSTGSVVVAHRLSCSRATKRNPPRPGIEPVSPPSQGRFVTPGPPGKPQEQTVDVAVASLEGQSTSHLPSCICAGQPCYVKDPRDALATRQMPDPNTVGPGKIAVE